VDSYCHRRSFGHLDTTAFEEGPWVGGDALAQFRLIVQFTENAPESGITTKPEHHLVR
jgi:hypothetical protein